MVTMATVGLKKGAMRFFSNLFSCSSHPLTLKMSDIGARFIRASRKGPQLRSSMSS